MNNNTNGINQADTNGITIGEAAEALGVTVRALHHWDAIGLASPSLRTWSDYRLYTSTDLQRLQRIAVYRELDLPLAEIGRILDHPEVDAVASLTEQKARILDKVGRLADLERGVDRMIAAHTHGVLLTVDQQRKIFGDAWDPEWTRQAREKWGETAQWSEYAERSATRTPQQWSQLQQQMAEVEERLAKAVERHVEPGSAEANSLVDDHRDVLSEYFAVTMSMQVCLGRMYESSAGSESDFAAHYEAIAPGLTSWLRQSIDARARSG